MFATVQSFTDLINVIAALNGTYGTIELEPASYSVASNYVIPDNISLVVNRGAIFVVGSGVTLTINAEIKAGRYQIFGDTGAISGSPKVEHIYPEWFHPGGTDWSIALQSAITFANGAIPVSLGHAVYGITQSIQFIPGTVLIGQDAKTSIIRRISDVSLNMLLLASNSIIRDIGVDGDRFHPAWIQGCAGVLLHGASGAEIFGCELRNVIVKNQQGQGISLQYARDNRFDNIGVSHIAERGINISAFSHGNVVSNLMADDIEKADVIIGHGSHSNIVSNVISVGCGITPIWLHEDAHDNTVSNVRMRLPKPPAYQGVLIANGYKNHIHNIHITGFQTGILLRSDSVTCSPQVPNLWDDDTRDNILSNINIDGVGGASSVGIALHKLYMQPWRQCAGTKRVVSNIFSNVTIDNVATGVLASSDRALATDVQDNIFANFIFHNVPATATFNWSGLHAPPVNKTPYP